MKDNLLTIKEKSIICYKIHSISIAIIDLEKKEKMQEEFLERNSFDNLIFH
jgi:hypothetical protein